MMMLSVFLYGQLSRDHQRLKQQSLELEDQLMTLRQQNSAELTSLQHELMSEMSVCALELDAIISVCLQSANGDEPNLSCLLSIPSKLLKAKAKGSTYHYKQV